MPVFSHSLHPEPTLGAYYERQISGALTRRCRRSNRAADIEVCPSNPVGMVLESCSTAAEPESEELLTQRCRGREMNRVDAEGRRGIDVCRDIVDVDGALRIDRKALDQQLEDARIRLDHPDLARDENA